MSERLDRRLVAVMFTDMVGYTALLQADERLALGKRGRYRSALESNHESDRLGSAARRTECKGRVVRLDRGAGR